MMGSNPSKQSILESDLKVGPICQLLPTRETVWSGLTWSSHTVWTSLLSEIGPGANSENFCTFLTVQ